MNKIFTALCLLFSLNVLCQTTYFVNDNASGDGNGNSWTNAFTKLQDALSAAGSGDQIWVAAGTYYPDEGVGLTNNNRSHSFHLKYGIAIYGGFAGTETKLSERNVTANVTTLSGDIDQDNTLVNNSFHVVQSIGVDDSVVLDGFTITAGNADNSNNIPDFIGGGIFNLSSSPILTNCSFSGNTADIGGGMFNDNSSPILTNCSFSGNTATKEVGGRSGGGIYNNSSSPILTNCSFSGNTADQNGGGMYNINSSPTLTNCSFSENSTSSEGGGMYNENSAPTLINCSFSANRADFQGGGIFNFDSAPILTNCSFSANTGGNGGGMYNISESSPILTNCILWGNTGDQIVNNDESNTVITYSIVQGGYEGTGNLDQDPLFVDAVNGDLHLQAGSPAIDAGLKSANTTSADMDGNPRVVNSTIDMGAFEFQGEGAVISSFTLIDADTDEEIRALKDGDTINLAALSSTQLTIRANTNPDSVGSVVFRLTGPQTSHHTENIAPYSLFVNNKGDYFGAELKPGDYTLTATPYSEAGGRGEKGTPLTIHFHVLYQVVNSFTLINADTDQDIRELKNGDVIDLSSLSSGTKLNVRANTDPAVVGSVAFQLSGPVKFWHTENTAPYALLVNNMSDYSGFIPLVGNYTLTATPYSGTRSSGQKGKSDTITFSVVNNLPVTGIQQRQLADAIVKVRGYLGATPNPSLGRTTISFSVPQSGYTTLELVDQKGTVVERLYASNVQKEQVYTLSFERKHLKSGVYVLRLIRGKNVQSYRLVLIQ